MVVLEYSLRAYGFFDPSVDIARALPPNPCLVNV